MEKRLPLALFLSFLVLFLWQMWFAPPPPEKTETPGQSTEEVPAPVAPATIEKPVPTIADSEPRESEPVILGAEGGGGHWRATFHNQGARLTQLEFQDFYRYFKREGLTAEEIDLAKETHRMPLIVPSDDPERPGGAFVLETSPSSAQYAPEGLADALWKMESSSAGASFEYGASTGFVFRKSLRPLGDKWTLELSLEFENGSQLPGGPSEFVLRPADFVPPELADRFYPEPNVIAAGPVGRPADLEVDSATVAGSVGESDTLDVELPLAEVGVHSKYFALLIRDAETKVGPTLFGARWTAFQETAPLSEIASGGSDAGPHVPPPLSGERMALEVPLSVTLPGPGEKAVYKYLVYAGPKDRGVMLDASPAAKVILDEDLSSWSPLAAIGRFILWALSKFHALVGNWGWAIILLTLCLRACLFPLQRRSQTAMARYSKTMKRVKPKLDELQEKFADDTQKQRQEQARIMQEEGAFPPIGGCLPMFLQIPVFIGLFSALRTSFDLRQAPFVGYIDDLSQPDRLFELGLEIPILITTLDFSYFNLLPILMVVLWILQQRGMPTPDDPQQAKMQKLMMWMPVMFGFMLYNYAAGLSLYMITQSGLGIIEQKVIRKVWPIDDTTPEKKEPKGCGPLSGAMQNLADKQRAEMERRQALLKQQQGRSKGGKNKKRK